MNKSVKRIIIYANSLILVFSLSSFGHNLRNVYASEVSPMISAQSQSSMNLYVDETEAINLSSQGEVLIYKSLNDEIATVNSQGIVKGIAIGKTTIEVSKETLSKINPAEYVQWVDLGGRATELKFYFKPTAAHKNDTFRIEAVYPSGTTSKSGSFDRSGVYWSNPFTTPKYNLNWQGGAVGDKGGIYNLYVTINGEEYLIFSGRDKDLLQYGAIYLPNNSNLNVASYVEYVDLGGTSNNLKFYFKPTAAHKNDKFRVEASYTSGIQSKTGSLDNNGIYWTSIFNTPNYKLNYDGHPVGNNGGVYSLYTTINGRETLLYTGNDFDLLQPGAIYLSNNKATDSGITTTEIVQKIDVTVSEKSKPTIDVNTKEMTLYVGENKKSDVTFTPQDGTLSYTSGDAAIAQAGQDGTITGVKPGQTTVNVVVTDKNGQTAQGTINVTVLEKPSININTKDITLYVGENKKPDVTFNPKDGNINYTSKDSAIAQAGQDGTITGVKPGQTTVNVVVTDKNGQTAQGTINVTVLEKPSININTKDITLYVGENKKPDVTFNPKDGNINYTSKDSAIAQAGQDGTITGVKPGQTTVNVVVTDKNGQTAQETINVTVLAKPTLTTHDVEVKMFKSIQANINYTPEDATVTYESVDPSIAKVDENGKISGVKAGDTKINVTVTDKNGQTVQGVINVKVIPLVN